MQLQFESFYKISTIALKTNGAHPQTPKNYKWAIWFLLMHGYYSFCFLFFVYNMIFDIRDLKDYLKASSHGVYCVLYLVVTFFYVVLLWFQDDINAIIKLQQNYFNSSRHLPAEDQKLICDYASKGRLVVKFWMVSTAVTLWMFPIKGGIMSAYSMYKGNLTLYPMGDNVYPPSIDIIKQRFDIFAIIYTLHLIYAAYAAFMYTGFAPLEPIFVYNICAQVELVTRKVEVLFAENKREFNREQTKGKIMVIAQNMQEIYSYVEKVNKIFTIVNELCLKASAVLIPVAIFIVLKMLDRGELGLDYIMFVYTALLLCFVPCYCSDLLVEKSEKLRIALYSSGWENFYDRSTRSSLLILLTRASEPVSIRSVFSVICLDTFTDLCRQSYALFNLMNAGLN